MACKDRVAGLYSATGQQVRRQTGASLTPLGQIEGGTIDAAVVGAGRGEMPYGMRHRAGQWLGALKVEPDPNAQSFGNPLGMPGNTR